MKKLRTNQNTDRSNRWKTSEKDANGNRYTCYKKIKLTELSKKIRRQSDDPKERSGDIIEYPYTENMLLYLISRKHIPPEGATQTELAKLINKTFFDYGLTSTQGNVSKALNELKKPFYYSKRDFLYTVVRRGKHYFIEKHLAGLKANANEFVKRYAKHLISDTPFLLSASTFTRNEKNFTAVDGFVFRVQPSYAQAMKNDMLDLFDANAFFNVIAYEDNLIVLLNQNYQHIRKLSETIENLFTSTSSDTHADFNEDSNNMEYIETEDDIDPMQNDTTAN